jgi:hypothetical protein
MNRQFIKALSVILVALLGISVMPAISNAYNVVTMWLDPSSKSLNTAEHSIGYKFSITVWLDAADKNVGSWQFYMIYNKNYLNVTSYTLSGPGGTISQFFYNSGTTTFVPPVAKGSHNATHNYLQMGESWLSGPPGTGVGTLAIIQFEVVGVPPKGGVIQSAIDISTGFAEGMTLVQEYPTMAMILQQTFDCAYTFTWVQPASPRLGVSPVSQEFGMFDNVVGRPVNVSLYILGLDAAWFLTNASFTFTYNSTLVSTEPANITVNTGVWNVAANVVVMDGIITVYVETSQEGIHGDVKIADVQFIILYQGTYPEVSVCPLEFSDVHLFDHIMEIPTQPPLNGQIRIIGYVALPMPHLEVVPKDTYIGPEPSLGKEFSVDVVMKGLREEWNLVGYSFRLTYCPSLLDVVGVTEGPFLGSTTSWGYIVFEDVELPAAAPPLYMSNVSILLKIVAERVGTYKFTLKAPSDVVVMINGSLTSTFTVAASGTMPYTTWRVIELRNYNAYPITYDYTLSCTPTTWGVTVYATFNKDDPGSVVEYPWFRNVAAPPYSWFFSGIDTVPVPHVSVGGMVATDTGEWFIFPKGDGVLATIRFKVLAQGYTNLTCTLGLFDIIMIDKTGRDIPYEPPVNGTVTVLALSLPGRQIDVYTQYPAPYGGQGPNNPSDMFWPQKLVILYANVTYNYWPQQNKLVSFEIIDNKNQTWDKKTALTNADGIASVSFRMPWPCDDPESLFGIWQVIATVDIACEVINDTLKFHYNYLVNIVKVTTDALEYDHGDTVTISIEVTSLAMQTYSVLVTAAIVDELGYTVGFAAKTITVGGAQFCTPKKYKLSLTITIPKFAAAGIATVHVNCFDKEPALGGVALCPEYPPPIIYIRPY